MAISYANTDKIMAISKKIKSLSLDLDKEIDDLFTRFSEVPTLTGEWVGQTSEYYFKTIAKDKKKYKNFISEIRDVANKLDKDCSDIQSCINKCMNNEG